MAELRSDASFDAATRVRLEKVVSHLALERETVIRYQEIFDLLMRTFNRRGRLYRTDVKSAICPCLPLINEVSVCQRI